MAYYGQVHYTPAYEARSSSYDIDPRQYENRGPAGSEYNDDLYQYGDEDTDDTYQAFFAYEPKSHASPLNGLIETISAELARGPTPYGQTTRYKGYEKTLVAFYKFANSTLNPRLSGSAVETVRSLEENAMDHLNYFRDLCRREMEAARELNQAHTNKTLPDALTGVTEGMAALGVSGDDYDDESTKTFTVADARAPEKVRRRKSGQPKSRNAEQSTTERSSGRRKKHSDRSKDVEKSSTSRRKDHDSSTKTGTSSSTADNGKKPHRSRREGTENTNSPSATASVTPRQAATSQTSNETQAALADYWQAEWDFVKKELDTTHKNINSSLTALQTWAENNGVEGFRKRYQMREKPVKDHNPLQYLDEDQTSDD